VECGGEKMSELKEFWIILVQSIKISDEKHQEHGMIGRICMHLTLLKKKLEIPN